jgi:hypothetical protein
MFLVSFGTTSNIIFYFSGTEVAVGNSEGVVEVWDSKLKYF